MRSRAHSGRRRTAGFTIIEVLVALALVAASLAAIGSVIAVNARATRMFEQRVALIQTARALEAGLARRDRLVPGSVDGEIGGRRWRIVVSPFATADGVKNSPWVAQSIAIRVRAPSGETIELDTARLRRRTRE